MAHHQFRTLVRSHARRVSDTDPAFAQGACSPWHGLLALYGDFTVSEPLAGLWLIPSAGPATMRSMLAQIARTLNEQGWEVDVDGLCRWWLAKTEPAVVAGQYAVIQGDDSGEGEYV